MRKNVASQNIAAQMNSRTDGSPLTSSVSVAVTIDGGTSTAGGGTLTHEAAGHWNYAPTQAETNGDHVAFQFTHASGINQVLNVYPTFPQTGDNFARIGAPVGASISADVAAVKAETASIQSDTNDIQTRIPAALVGGRMDVSVGAMANNVLTAAAINADAITDAKVASDVTIASVTGAVGSVTGNVGGNVTGSVGSVATGGITRASLAADTGLQSVRSNTAQAGGSTSITLDASASSTTDFYVNHLVLLTGGTGAGQARFITAYNGTTKVATVTAWATNPDNTSTFAILPGDAIPGATAPTAAQVADAVWDEALSGHAVSGSTGEALAAAGSAGDPWITALPGAYSSGQAGYIVGTMLDAAMSSRASQSSLNTLDDFVDTEVAAIKAKTDNLPASPAAVSDIPTAIENADALLARDLGSGSGAGTLNERTVRSALRFPRNKYTLAGGTLTVMKEDDSTTAWTAAVTGTAGADPVTGSDPT